METLQNAKTEGKFTSDLILERHSELKSKIMCGKKQVMDIVKVRFWWMFVWWLSMLSLISGAVCFIVYIKIIADEDTESYRPYWIMIGFFSVAALTIIPACIGEIIGGKAFIICLSRESAAVSIDQKRLQKLITYTVIHRVQLEPDLFQQAPQTQQNANAQYI